MQTTKIFLVDIGSEFYKLGFAREDCSILEKTPSGIFDDQKRLIDSEKYAKIIVEHLNTLVVPNDNQQNIQNQIVDQPVNQLQNHQMYINLVIAHNNNCHILNHLFHACKYLKGVLFVNPAVMDCYATGRTTGLVINLSSNWLHGAIIIESKVIYEDSIRIRTDQNNVIENECSEKIQVTQNHEKGSKPKEQKNKDLKLKEEE
ncbi:actin, partial [Pseudoloma neurophilia]